MGSSSCIGDPDMDTSGYAATADTASDQPQTTWTVAQRPCMAGHAVHGTAIRTGLHRDGVAGTHVKRTWFRSHHSGLCRRCIHHWTNGIYVVYTVNRRP